MAAPREEKKTSTYAISSLALFLSLLSQFHALFYLFMSPSFLCGFANISKHVYPFLLAFFILLSYLIRSSFTPPPLHSPSSSLAATFLHEHFHLLFSFFYCFMISTILFSQFDGNLMKMAVTYYPEIYLAVPFLHPFIFCLHLYLLFHLTSPSPLLSLCA